MMSTHFKRFNQDSLSQSSSSFKSWLCYAFLPVSLCFGCGNHSTGEQANPNHEMQSNPQAESELEGMESNPELEASEYTLIRSDREHDDSPEVSPEVLSQHIMANQEFSFTLHREAVPKDKANVMLSAWSVRQAFALMLPGANERGREAISATLGFDLDLNNALRATNELNDELDARQMDESESQAPIILRSANSIWVDYDSEIQDPYLDMISEHLDTGVYMVDFKGDPERAHQTINTWVEEKTQDRIQNLLPRNTISELTKTVFTNAVFFKAPWNNPFNEQATTTAPFMTSAGEEVMTAMMRGEQYASAATVDGTQVLTLPFRDHKLAMTFLMPIEDSVTELEMDLNAESWADLLSQQVNELRIVTLPKFKFETTVPELGDYFKEKETNLLFESGAIDQVLSEQALVISKIVHKSFIEITETGGEASAATAIIATEPSIPEYGPEVVIDRAFLFAIHDQTTGAILFFGKVGNPSE